MITKIKSIGIGVLALLTLLAMLACVSGEREVAPTELPPTIEIIAHQSLPPTMLPTLSIAEVLVKPTSTPRPTTPATRVVADNLDTNRLNAWRIAHAESVAECMESPGRDCPRVMSYQSRQLRVAKRRSSMTEKQARADACLEIYERGMLAARTTPPIFNPGSTSDADQAYKAMPDTYQGATAGNPNGPVFTEAEADELVRSIMNPHCVAAMDAAH